MKQLLKKFIPVPVQEIVKQAPIIEPLFHSRAISTLEELDAEIERCDQLAAISADEFSKAVSSFHFQVKQPIPSDP